MIIVRSPLRISFGGGGTDLPAYFEKYGGAVLSTAINKYTYAIINQRADAYIQIISSDLKVFHHWNSVEEMNLQANGGELAIPVAVLKNMGVAGGVDVFLASEVCPGTGLGSSASICVSILHAVATHLGMSLSKQELASMAFSIGSQAVGTSVGKQDEFASSLGGLNFLKFNEDGSTGIEPVHLRATVLRALERRLMLFFTGTIRNSWTILKEKESLINNDGEGVIQALHWMRGVAQDMRQALLQEDLQQFGLLLHEAWENKKRTANHISTPFIDYLYRRAREQGAIGGKIAGAGGGGFMLLYCDEGRQNAVRQALAREGIQEMRFAFDFVGSRVLANDHPEARLMSAAFGGRGLAID